MAATRAAPQLITPTFPRERTDDSAVYTRCNFTVAETPLTIGDEVLPDGWAVGRLGWDNRRTHHTDRLGVYLELTLKYRDHYRGRVVPSGFRCLLNSSIYDGEHHDTRSEPQGWGRPGFDAADWAHVEDMDWPQSAFLTPTANPIRKTQELEPVKIITTPLGKTVVDFGQNLAARLCVHVEGAPVDTITLREHCGGYNGGGRLAVAPIRFERVRGAGPPRLELRPPGRTRRPPCLQHGHASDSPGRGRANVAGTHADVFSTYLPSSPFGSSSEADSISLNVILQYIPDASERLPYELRAVLGTPTEGNNS